jgi:hypothetical protein
MQEMVPENVKILQMSFEDVKNLIQQKFDFPIQLLTPYKLCDFKPAYGEIFQEYISQYDFWGYGDIDLIYGNLRQFITEELLSSFDRIFSCGHLSIIKNEDKWNTVYRKDVPGCFSYRNVFSEKDSFTFDEWGRNDLGGYFQIAQQSGMKIYNKKLYADIDVKFNALKCDFGGNKEQRQIEYNKKKIYYEFNRGKLVQHWKNNSKDFVDLAYIHLQKRAMRNYCNDDMCFYIYPHCFSNKYKQHFCDIGLNPRFVRLILNKIARFFACSFGHISNGRG